jgi:hypothetical protein
MRSFMFLCPNTGYIVQARADDAAPGEKPCIPVSCASCGRSHLVDPATLSLQNEESAQWPNAPEWLLPLGTTLNQSRRRALLR